MSIYSLSTDTSVKVKVNLFINDMVPLENADMVRLSAISLNKNIFHCISMCNLFGVNRKTLKKLEQEILEQFAKFLPNLTIKIKLNLTNHLLPV